MNEWGGGMHGSGLQEILGDTKPSDVFPLLLVQGALINEVADLVGDAHLSEVLVEGFLQLLVDIVELGAVVAANALLFLSALEGLDISDDVPAILASFSEAIEDDAGSLRLALHCDGEVGTLIRWCLTFLAHLGIEGAPCLPLDADDLVSSLSFQHHVDVALCVDELEVGLGQEVLDALVGLELRLLMLQFSLQDLGDLASSTGEAPLLLACDDGSSCCCLPSHHVTPKGRRSRRLATAKQGAGSCDSRKAQHR
mmetsp:Transcript_3123/g.4227  ORF Transcript_3123/g.4227 Transcript_3123/m.4227 type:complete len:254 (+) Transcript_3123:420-1181(+)